MTSCRLPEYARHMHGIGMGRCTLCATWDHELPRAYYYYYFYYYY